jgi:dihydroflavonol-4-reductase
MKILVTGAAGLLGSHIVRKLLEHQHQPFCLIRKSTDTSTLKGLDVDYVYGNIENKAEVDLAVQQCDAVIHAASIFSHPDNDSQVFEKINVTGTKNIVESIQKYKLKKLVYISTANTVGTGSKTNPGKEGDPFDSYHLESNYLNSKLRAEQYILDQVKKGKLDAVIISPTFMIGAYDSKPSSGRMIIFGVKSKVLFVPPGGKNFVHVTDVAEVSVKALESSQKGEKYLVAGGNYSYGEFFTLLLKQNGQQKPMIRIPKKVFVAAAHLVQTIKGKKAEFNVSNAKVLGRENYYDGSKAQKTFSYQPRPITQAVQEALAWFKDIGSI